jgi:integrase
LRIGEALALRGQDVRLAERRILVRAGKTAAASRMVPVSDALAPLMGDHFVRTTIGPTDLVFQGRQGDYRTARRVFRRAVRLAKVAEVRIHDLRHTFAVHAVQSGVPLPRLQKLLGHATPAMVMRYAAHAPEAYLDEDAGRVGASLTSVADREALAQAELSRQQLRLVESA